MGQFMSDKKVLVFGFSDNPERYSNKAFHLLKEYHHDVVAFSPRSDNPMDLPRQFETITFYVSLTIQEKFEELILSLDFRRAIFNPGAENPVLEKKLRERGVDVVIGCTLVMLKTNQF
jgi:predicted CoA-binding protein